MSERERERVTEAGGVRFFYVFIFYFLMYLFLGSSQNVSQ